MPRSVCLESLRLRPASPMRIYTSDLPFTVTKAGRIRSTFTDTNCKQDTRAAMKRVYLSPTSTLLKNIARVFAAIASNCPLLLEGPSGIDKTAVFNQVAYLLTGKRAHCVRIDFSTNTTLDQFFGSITPRFVGGRWLFEWQDGILLQALKVGPSHPPDPPQNGCSLTKSTQYLPRSWAA